MQKIPVSLAMKYNNREVAAREKEMLRLIRVKAEKAANDFLVQEEHTQLSHLSKEGQEYYTALPMVILLDRIMAYLQKQ